MITAKESISEFLAGLADRCSDGEWGDVLDVLEATLHRSRTSKNEKEAHRATSRFDRDVVAEVAKWEAYRRHNSHRTMSEVCRQIATDTVAARHGYERRLSEGRDEVDMLRMGKHQAYAERNKLVAWLAAIFPSTMCKTDIEGWDPEWHWCVYLDTPEGQMSWHIRESELEGFDHVPKTETKWDGHTTYSKYARVGRLARFERRGGVED